MKSRFFLLFLFFASTMTVDNEVCNKMGVINVVDRCKTGKDKFSFKTGRHRGRRNGRFSRNSRNNPRAIRDRLNRVRRRTPPLETVPYIDQDDTDVDEQVLLNEELDDDDDEIEVQFCRSRPSKKLLYIDCICKPSHCKVDFFSPSSDLLLFQEK